MTTLGITQGKINDALAQCIKAGMSRKQAVKVLYKMWNYSEPDDTTE